MSCNCNPEALRKKYAGFFFDTVKAPSKPEKAMEKKLKEESTKKKEKK